MPGFYVASPKVPSTLGHLVIKAKFQLFTENYCIKPSFALFYSVSHKEYLEPKNYFEVMGTYEN